MAERIREYLQLENFDEVEELPLNGFLNVVPVVPENEAKHLRELASSGVDVSVCNDNHCLVAEELNEGDVVLFAVKQPEHLDPLEILALDEEAIKNPELRNAALPSIQEEWRIMYKNCGLLEDEIERVVCEYPNLTRKAIQKLAQEAYYNRLQRMQEEQEVRKE